MSNIGDRMADSEPRRARTKEDADKIQAANEKRVRKMLEDLPEDPPEKS